MADHEQPYQVAVTGAHTTPLVGGRSRRTLNGVPILELNEKVARKVAKAQRDLHDPETETPYLVNEQVYLHTPQGRGLSGPDLVHSSIGGETLDEAAKTCVGVFEDGFSDVAPDWVASTHDDLAEVIAEHYGIPVKSIDEELSA